MTELTTSKMDNNKFYLGQLELSVIIRRIIRHYRYHRNNENPKAVVIPYLTKVEEVSVEYEQPEVRPKASRPSVPHNPDDSGD